MKVLGITGGIGCGKSTVIDILKDNYECYIISTDHVAAELMKKGNAAYMKVVDYFGNTILLEDGEINREELAKRVFKNEKELLKLNSFTHPLTREEVMKRINEKKSKEATTNQCQLIIIETALPYEARLSDYCDDIWYVTASQEARRERLKKSRGYSDEKINDIFSKQLSEDAYRELCKHVIVNDSTKEEVLRQAKVILENE